MRAALLVLLAALAALPVAAAAPVDLSVQSDGPPASVAWDTHGTLLPGDDDVYAAQSVQAVGVAVAEPFPGSVLPALAVQADLRDLRVREPALLLVRSAGALAAPLGLPAGIAVGHRDVTLTADAVNPANGHGGPMSATLDDPNPDTWGPPVTVDDQSVAVEPTLTSDSDRFTQRVDTSLTQACFRLGADARYAASQAYPPAAPSGPRCPQQALAPWVEPLLPTFRGRYELQRVSVLLDLAARDARDALSLAGSAPGAGAAGAAGSAPAAPGSDALPVGAPALARLGPQAAPGAPALAAPGLAPSGADEALVAPRAPEMLLAGLAGAGLALLAVPLYRRLVQRDVAAHPVRRRILEAVAARPGIHETEAAGELGISHTLAQYHVRTLVEFGALEMKRFAGRKCLFLPGQAGRAEKTVLVAGRSGKGGQLLDLVAAQPGIGQRALSRQLGIRESSVKWHLDRLAEQGLLLVERTPTGKQVRLTDDAQRARAAPVVFTAQPRRAPRLEPRPEPRGPAPEPAPGPAPEPLPLHADLAPVEAAA